MTLLARIRSLFAGLTGRRRIEESMRDEMRFHMEAYEQDLMKSGLSRPEAARRARLEFGTVEVKREECRQARGLRWADEISSDLKFGVRMLRRNPMFTASALLSLGLGIGANTAIFSMLNAVLLKTLPVADSSRLFFVDNSGGKSGGSSGPPYPCFELMRDGNQSFSSLTAFSGERFRAIIDGAQEPIFGQFASSNYFETLGVKAALGRTMVLSDETAGVISYGYWQRRFGMNPNVLGKVITLDGNAVTIVGVAPPGFYGLDPEARADLTVPIQLKGRVLQSRALWWMSVAGRLKEGRNTEQARIELDRIFQAYMTEIGMKGELRKHFDRISLVPADRGLGGIRKQLSKPLAIVMAIVSLVLLIGCANVANLLMARATARQSEIEIRLAIGAGRGRLIRQLLTEGLMLAVLGSLTGMVIAFWGARYLASFLAGPAGRPVLEPEFDWRVLAFATGAALVTGLLFSLAPALRATRITAWRPRLAMDRALVTVQLTLSLVLLAGAGLFVQTLINLKDLDAGFAREGVSTIGVEVVRKQRLEPADKEKLVNQWEQLGETLRAVPGVSEAAISTLSPLSGRDRGIHLVVPGEPERPERERYIHLNQVTEGYFDATGIGLLAGRLFTRQDGPQSLRVTILNEQAAQFYFGGAKAIGRRVSFPGQPVKGDYEVVGVVRNVRYESLRQEDERMAYVPMGQGMEAPGNVIATLRSRTDVGSAAREKIRATIPEAFAMNIVTMDQRVEQALVRERMVALLASLFSGLAMLLACIGLYGVLSYSVIQRTKEIGIRIAIGARGGAVVWLVLRETLLTVGFGLLAGTAIAYWVVQFVRSELFGLTPGWPVALTGATVLLAIVSGAAALTPALRASRVNPLTALRHE